MGGRYDSRFGMVYFEFKTLERTPKLTAEWFSAAATQNAVVRGPWAVSETSAWRDTLAGL
jgi:beta-glucosidase/6-phospho-beta-glucosidase/beta-galactosidase